MGGYDPQTFSCAGLILPDDSYYYFNQSGSHYWGSGQPGNPEASGGNTFKTPSGEVFSTPSKPKEQTGSYFLGIDVDSSRQKIYFEDKHGNITLTLWKNIADSDALPRKLVSKHTTLSGAEVYVEVNERGSYAGNNPDLAEQLRPANWVHPAVAELQGLEEEEDRPRPVARRLSFGRRDPHTPPPSSPHIKEEDDDDNHNGGGPQVAEEGEETNSEDEQPEQTRSQPSSQGSAGGSSSRSCQSSQSSRRKRAAPAAPSINGMFRVSKSGSVQKGKEIAERLVAKLAHTERVGLAE